MCNMCRKGPYLCRACGQYSPKTTQQQHESSENLELSFIEVLQPLQRHNFVEASHERLCLVDDATIEEPLSHQTVQQSPTWYQVINLANVIHHRIHLFQSAFTIQCQRLRFVLTIFGAI